MNSTFFDYLKAHGFDIEIGGGGTEMLTRYWPNRVAIWVTGSNGPGLPDDDDWLICVYAPDGDTMTDALFSASSDEGDPSDTEWRPAIQNAIDFARGLSVGLAGAPAASPVFIEVAAIVEHRDAFERIDDAGKAHGFGVYLCSPTALHVIDFMLPSWLDGNDEARGQTISAAFAYADELATSLGGVPVQSELTRPLAPVDLCDLLHAAACLWEEAQKIVGTFADANNAPLPHTPQGMAGFLREWDDMGSVHMRFMVTGWAEECERDWKRATDAGEFDSCFDWEWVPAWMSRKLAAVYPVSELVTVDVPTDGRRMIAGDIYAGETAYGVPIPLYAYPAEEAKPGYEAADIAGDVQGALWDRINCLAAPFSGTYTGMLGEARYESISGRPETIEVTDSYGKKWTVTVEEAN